MELIAIPRYGTIIALDCGHFIKATGCVRAIAHLLGRGNGGIAVWCEYCGCTTLTVQVFRP